MNRTEIKAVLEKQLQLLSEHSAKSVDLPDDQLSKNAMTIMFVADKLMQINAEEENAKKETEFFWWEKRIDRQYRIGMWLGLAALASGAVSLILRLF